MFEVSWSGKYPSLCCGEWTILRYGVDVSSFIPDELRHAPMNTYGTYWYWYFTDDWDTEEEDYTDGLKETDWIEENREWLKNICASDFEMSALFHAIQKKDWREESCGGCI
jgi:hypothetical protein